jgi:hypothetical protein
MNRMTIAAALAAMTVTAAGAAELEYGVEAGVGTSDNIRRVPTGEESETILTTGVDLALLREEGKLHADVNLDLSYLDYQDSSYDGEVTGMANADLRFLFVPGRFEWSLTDSFGQSQLDPFAAVTPDNRENVNYLTTGPDLTLRLGSAGSLTIFGRYSATQFEESSFDDDRLLGGLSFGREFSARSSLSLNATVERVEFDDQTAGSDYDRQSAFLRYDARGARTTIGAEAGYTEIHDNGATNSSPLFELDVTRNLSERSTLSLRGGIRSSDAASALRDGNITGGGIPGRPAQVSTTDTFETRHAALGWQFSAQRTRFELSAGNEEDRYDSATQLDRDRRYYRASVSRQVTPRFDVRLTASLLSSDYDTAGQGDDETQYGAYFTWNVSGRLYLLLDAEHFSRDSSNLLSEFDETRAFLRLAWRSVGGGPGGQ